MEPEEGPKAEGGLPFEEPPPSDDSGTLPALPAPEPLDRYELDLAHSHEGLGRAPAGAPRLRLVAVEQVGLVAEGLPIRTPADAASTARSLIGRMDREHFLVLHLDGKHRAVSAETVSVGTVSTALVHPREVFKGAFLANASAIICAHNHPSGLLEASHEDRAIFDRLSEAGKLLGVPMLDFLIVSSTDSWSARGHWGH